MTIAERLPPCIVLTALLSAVGGTAYAQERSVSPVQYIDHIMIRTDRPVDVFALLTDILHLPIAWPLADRGGVTSGGVGFGNVNVEAIRFPAQSGQPAGTHLVGFGFKPIALTESLAELTRRGIAYGIPRPFVSRDPSGARMTLFTNVTLSAFSDADRPPNAVTHIFLSEYNSAYVDADQRRARLRRELVEIAGGSLCVTAMKEVIVGTTNLATARPLWQALLNPARPSSPDLWHIGDGPALRLVQADENRLQGIVVAVASLRKAVDFLERSGLLGAASEREAIFDAAKVYGLQIRLVEGVDPAPDELLKLTCR